MSNIKDGKRPISHKIQAQSFFSEDSLGNLLAIPADVQAELESKGLTGRWLNAKELYTNQGYHKRGWKVYKREKPSSDIMSLDFKTGSDPEGIVRRGDLILGVKNKEEIEKHRGMLKSKAQRSSNINSEKANELRSLLGQAGIKKAKVFEGYDDNE